VDLFHAIYGKLEDLTNVFKIQPKDERLIHTNFEVLQSKEIKKVLDDLWKEGKFEKVL